MQLHNRTLFITGATSGFGLAIAKQSVKMGARVIISGRRAERLAALAEELGVDKAHPLPLDVRNRQAVFQAVENLPAAFAAPDALINNAGLALGLSSIESALPEDIEQMVDTNIKGMIHCTQALLPGMIARRSGHVVNMGSIAGNYPYPGGNVYGGTKAFVKQFSLNLRADLSGKNVRVTNIEPGLAETEFSLVRFHGNAEKAGSVYRGTAPLSADDIADAVMWALTRPAHVNINRIEIMPSCQSFAPFAIERDAS